MSTLTITAGYCPTHRVTVYARWVDSDADAHTDWQAACGAQRSELGWARVLGRAGTVRVNDLCAECFPAQDALGWYPDAQDCSRPDGRRPERLQPGLPPAG